MAALARGSHSLTYKSRCPPPRERRTLWRCLREWRISPAALPSPRRIWRIARRTTRTVRAASVRANGCAACVPAIAVARELRFRAQRQTLQRVSPLRRLGTQHFKCFTSLCARAIKVNVVESCRDTRCAKKLPYAATIQAFESCANRNRTVVGLSLIHI